MMRAYLNTYDPENVLNSHTVRRLGPAKAVATAGSVDPQRGGNKTTERKALERSREFKKGQAFRSGIEGRISVLFRGRGMKRCLSKGRERFKILVGAAVLANNLMRIAELLKDKKTKTKHRAVNPLPERVAFHSGI